MLRTDDFSFELPPDLIAAYPAPRRDGSRLLVLRREDGAMEHRSFADLPRLLAPSDLLVLNDSRVRRSVMATCDRALEILLLEETSPRHWVCLVKPGKKARPGQRLVFPGARAGKVLEAEVLRTREDGARVLRFFQSFQPDDVAGMPIPPYILKRREAIAGGPPDVAALDAERYQTVYAREEGSVAAPTAGLHFTPELLAQCRHAFVTLHVGLGTFRPVKTEFVQDHEMHEEWFSIPDGLDEQIKAAGRVVAVGTTAARVLESAPSLRPQHGRTRIFIHAPYRFRRVDVLLTNFHLPKSTLLMLVCAFAGRDLVLRAYAEAIAQRYRFFSYGDAMLIL